MNIIAEVMFWMFVAIAISSVIRLYITYYTHPNLAMVTEWIVIVGTFCEIILTIAIVILS